MIQTVWKAALGAWQIINLIFRMAKFTIFYIRPIREDVIRICQRVKNNGLENKEARDKVFQEITDCLQARGILENYPDAKINWIQEGIYLFLIKKGDKNEKIRLEAGHKGSKRLPVQPAV